MLDYQYVDGTRLLSVIEALIFSSPAPIKWEKISEIIKENEEEIDLDMDTIENAIIRLNNRYEENDLSFRIEHTGGGFTFVTHPRYYPWLSVYQHENAYRKLSQSAIEALAIVAYRQPITKPEVDSIRGVDSGYILRQLMEKMLIRVSGRSDTPGKPLLYKTTSHFLRHFGINNVNELPRPREIDDILKDDDMAEHRRLLMERQMELQDDEAREIFDGFIEERHDAAEEYDEEVRGDEEEAGLEEYNEEVRHDAAEEYDHEEDTGLEEYDEDMKDRNDGVGPEE